MGIPIFQVDAFTDAPFGGNPAVVCLLDRAADDRWMQRVAAEMNVSETAFLGPEGDGGRTLRWFTPSTEVDLCGHATLATAHVLWESGRLAEDEPARFETRSGLLIAIRGRDGIWLDLPALPPEEISEPEELAGILRGRGQRFVGRGELDLLVELESEEAVRSLLPDLELISRLPCEGLIVTAPSEDPQYDFVSRYFAPSVGIPEDPATGAAHCCLGPYWQGRLGKSVFTALQASPRIGVMKVQVAGDRVRLGGRAVSVFRGELVRDPAAAR